MGKRDKSQVINNIDQLNLEIDYDKLAEAIVKAQKEATESEKAETNIKEKQNIFKSIFRILRGERSKDGRMLSTPFAFLVSYVFRITAISGVILLVLFDIGFVKSFAALQWQGAVFVKNILAIGLIILANVAIFLFMVLFWGAANDVEYEKDKNYVVGVFSGIVSVAALIVAIIALFNGIG